MHVDGYFVFGEKDIEIQPCQDMNLGLLIANQLLLQTEPLELCHYGICL